jgi:hypothetical protein
VRCSGERTSIFLFTCTSFVSTPVLPMTAEHNRSVQQKKQLSSRTHGRGRPRLGTAAGRKGARGIAAGSRTASPRTHGRGRPRLGTAAGRKGARGIAAGSRTAREPARREAGRACGWEIDLRMDEAGAVDLGCARSSSEGAR